MLVWRACSRRFCPLSEPVGRLEFLAPRPSTRVIDDELDRSSWAWLATPDSTPLAPHPHILRVERNAKRTACSRITYCPAVAPRASRASPRSGGRRSRSRVGRREDRLLLRREVLVRRRPRRRAHLRVDEARRRPPHHSSWTPLRAPRRISCQMPTNSRDRLAEQGRGRVARLLRVPERARRRAVGAVPSPPSGSSPSRLARSARRKPRAARTATPRTRRSPAGDEGGPARIERPPRRRRRC